MTFKRSDEPQARAKAGLPRDLVLYCAPYDYGTEFPCGLAISLVTKTMVHRDVKTEMHYQPPELELVRAALDYTLANYGMRV
jgi:hypothetical protein